MSDDHVYLTLAEGHGTTPAGLHGHRLRGPAARRRHHRARGVDAGELAADCVALADDALVSAQRLAEWVARRSWRRRWRWPTSASTCSARPVCSTRARARSTAPAATRTPTPTSGTPATSAT
ncbi:hypothetical protein LV779_07630 [Streptomyces thinghirensis]|nr:hypothetical protein [Streptomyces thinghirensis]